MTLLRPVLRRTAPGLSAAPRVHQHPGVLRVAAGEPHLAAETGLWGLCYTKNRPAGSLSAEPRVPGACRRRNRRSSTCCRVGFDAGDAGSTLVPSQDPSTAGGGGARGHWGAVGMGTAAAEAPGLWDVSPPGRCHSEQEGKTHSWEGVAASSSLRQLPGCRNSSAQLPPASSPCHSAGAAPAGRSGAAGAGAAGAPTPPLARHRQQ